MPDMPTILTGIQGVKEAVGKHLGWTDYIEVTQEQVKQFADATGDHQWMHGDVDQAGFERPFGGPAAHGYLTLSLLATFVPQLLRRRGFAFGVNYGADKVRFLTTVPVGSKLRAGAQIDQADEIEGGVQLTMTVTLETKGATKPCLVATVLYRWYT
jgi:acyl dehydratase